MGWRPDLPTFPQQPWGQEGQTPKKFRSKSRAQGAGLNSIRDVAVDLEENSISNPEGDALLDMTISHIVTKTKKVSRSLHIGWRFS